MRESIGSTWVLQIVIVFILLFVSFLTLSLSYSKSFKVKNETLSIIEKYEGLTTDAVKIINNYLEYNSYSVKKSCPDNTWLGLSELNLNVLEQAQSDKKYYYCVKKRKVGKERYYYELKTFFNFNLPAIGEFVVFTLDGTTADITIPNGGMDNYTAY